MSSFQVSAQLFCFVLDIAGYSLYDPLASRLSFHFTDPSAVFFSAALALVLAPEKQLLFISVLLLSTRLEER